MYCKACGKQIPDDSAFCNKCGVPQGKATSALSSTRALYHVKAGIGSYTVTPTQIVIEAGRESFHLNLHQVSGVRENIGIVSRQVCIDMTYGETKYLNCNSKQDAREFATAIRNTLALL